MELNNDHVEIIFQRLFDAKDKDDGLAKIILISGKDNNQR